MNNYSIASLIVILIFLVYLAFKMIKTREFEQLLINKQQEKKVILERKTYRREYVMIFIMVFMFGVTLNINTKTENVLTDIEYLNRVVEKELPELLNEDLEGLYIVTINSLDANIEYTTQFNNAPFIDYRSYNIEGESFEVVEDMLTSSVTLNTTMIESTVNYQAYAMYDLCSENVNQVEVEQSYLVIGAMFNVSESNSLSDDRINNLEFLYPWRIFLIEGYDKDKSIDEQSIEVKEEIIRIIREYLD